MGNISPVGLLSMSPLNRRDRFFRATATAGCAFFWATASLLSVPSSSIESSAASVAAAYTLHCLGRVDIHIALVRTACPTQRAVGGRWHGVIETLARRTLRVIVRLMMMTMSIHPINAMGFRPIQTPLLVWPVSVAAGPQSLLTQSFPTLDLRWPIDNVIEKQRQNGPTHSSGQMDS